MSDFLSITGFLLQGLTLIVLALSLVQLFRSQGRLLLRLDSMERTLSGLQARGPETGLVNIETPAGPPSLEVGAQVEDFQLPDLTGKTVSLSDFRGKKVLLIYWSPSCGYCDMAADTLVSLQEEFRQSGIQPVLVAYESAAANRQLAEEHKLNVPILVMENAPAQAWITDTLFQYCGTPSSYLLDADGKVAHPLAVGADTIFDAARKTKPGGLKKLPLSESNIERNGIKAGTLAPAFALPDIHGETVTLDQFRGKKVLLVFSDPHCGPCDELAPRLVKLHREHRNNGMRGMQLVLVGRGELEDNKQKAVDHAMEFPVVVQKKWKLSQQYGIFATPVAFLIGGDGVTMKDVAMGPEQILKLAQEGLAG